MKTTNMEMALQFTNDKTEGSGTSMNLINLELQKEKLKNDIMKKDMRGHHYSYGR